MTTTQHGCDDTTGDGGRPRIVVIEDERTLAEAVALRLQAAGFDVAVALDGTSGLAACEPLPDLVLLDWMLPDLDGLEVCRRLRARGDVPVLLLTARTAEDDVLEALAAGVDDHLRKPVGMRELVARVRALLRLVERSAVGATPDLLELGEVEVDVAARRVTRSGEPVHLTATEFDLLVRLGERPGAVVARERLLRDVWGLPADAPSRTLDTHVAELRRKLGADVVRTVHGVGYATAGGAADGSAGAGQAAAEDTDRHGGGAS